jgi:hypothetical protein
MVRIDNNAGERYPFARELFDVPAGVAVWRARPAISRQNRLQVH